MRVNLDNMAVVLHRPKYPENIGASARAALNMGISRLIVVEPRDCDLTRILKMATHFAADLVEKMEVYEDLETALSPFQYVVGTTARVGSRRPALSDPRKVAETLVPISQENLVALVFGPENSGLTNAELRLCHAMVTIPTAEFASLNVAQAVMIFCYEVLLASREDATEFTPRLATHHELEAMYGQLKETLVGMFVGSSLGWTCERGMSGWSGVYVARSSGMDRGPQKSLQSKEPPSEYVTLITSLKRANTKVYRVPKVTCPPMLICQGVLRRSQP